MTILYKPWHMTTEEAQEIMDEYNAELDLQRQALPEWKRQLNVVSVLLGIGCPAEFTSPVHHAFESALWSMLAPWEFDWEEVPF